MKNYWGIFIIFLCGISIFSILKYSAVLKEKHSLKDSLSKLKEQLVVLEKNLSQKLDKEEELNHRLGEENLALQAASRAYAEKIAKLEREFIRLTHTLEDLSSQLSALKAENTALIEEKNNLSAELTQMIEQRDELKARLSSVAELKKAIRELKRHRPQLTVARKLNINNKEDSQGNHGFLLKDGQSTYPMRVKIEVIPQS